MRYNPDTHYYGTATGSLIPVAAILDRLEINSTGRLCDREFEPIPEIAAYALDDYRQPQRVSLPTMGGR